MRNEKPFCSANYVEYALEKNYFKDIVDLDISQGRPNSIKNNKLHTSLGTHQIILKDTINENTYIDNNITSLPEEGVSYLTGGDISSVV